MLNAVIEPIKRAIRSNRRSKIVSISAGLCEKFLHSYYNEDFYEFRANGESFALSTFSRWIGSSNCIVWDIGANHGQWAREAHAILPNAQVVSFEIIPPIADELSAAADSSPWWSIEKIGMSNKEGVAEIFWNWDSDDTSSLSPDLNGHLYASAKVESVQCQTTTIDAYWSRAGSAPHLLKIDTEGHDWAVLEGAEELLSSADAPAMIQFEYGHTWIPSQRMLGPVQKKLESFGYSVGRLYPNHVEFKPYSVLDENFRMGNMIAVRDSRLRDRLSWN